jgi:cholesterol oxidase
VRRFEPLPDGGYRVHYVVHNLQNENPQGRSGELAEQHGTMTAPRLVIAAGTLGSTYLLLRNRAAFPRLSDRLGTGFSGNGDLLTLALRPTRREGGATVRMPIDGGYGPAITAAVRFADTLDGPGPEGRGFYLEDAGYPDLLAWLMEAGELPMGLWNARHQLLRQIRLALRGMPDTDVAAELSALLGDQPFSAGALPMLGMGRDEPGGRMSLSGRTLQVDWKLDQSRPYFQRVRHAMEKMAGALGAQFMDNPMWHLGNRVITVHPLGGVPMGRDPEHGVVDSWGRAFGYDGLYVADGSIMPGAVGPNPSLTIAAMADRIATGMLGQAEEAPR